MHKEEAQIQDLVGKTLTRVWADRGRCLVFELANGSCYQLHHEQDCCEGVEIESIAGDLEDLVGVPILLAEEATSDSAGNETGQVPMEHKLTARLLGEERDADSYTWTFYKFATRKGYVDVRWFGESNGYYSESVSFSYISASPPADDIKGEF